MIGGLEGGLLLALASTVALDAGFLLQQHAASRLPSFDPRRPLRALRSLLGARRWVAGFLTGVLGWALYVLALAHAPLSDVQAVSASGIALMVAFLALARHALPGRRSMLGAAVATAALAGLGLSLAGSRAPAQHAVRDARFAACAVAVAVASALLARRGSAALGGIAAGLLYGLGDVASKALLVALPRHPGPVAIGTQPYFYVALAAHGLGFVALQHSFQRGGVVAAVAPMNAALTLLPMAAGVLVLGDPLPSSPVALALRLTAFAGAAWGAYLLAGARETAAPAGPGAEPVAPRAHPGAPAATGAG